MAELLIQPAGVSGSPDGAAALRLRRYLADRNVPCPGCGYDLRGLTTAVCPECGEELRLRIGLVEPKLKAFFATIIGLGAGLGFNGLLLGFFVWIRLVGRWSYGPGWMEAAPLVVSLIFIGASLASVLSTRSAMRRLRVEARVALAVGAWLLSIASAVMFFNTVR